jgi:hypothetical protein
MRLVALSLVKKLDMDIYEILVNKRWVEDPIRSSKFKPYISKYQPGDDKFLGKLGFKIEPAGKIRVFAMVDAWTQ